MMCRTAVHKNPGIRLKTATFRAFAATAIALSFAGCSDPESGNPKSKSAQAVRPEEAPPVRIVSGPQPTSSTLTLLPNMTDINVEAMHIPALVAKFGETEITREQYVEELKTWQRQFDAQSNMMSQRVGRQLKSLPIPPDERQNALNVLIGKVLLLELATAAGVEVADVEVERKIAEGKAKLTDAADYQAYLSWYEFDEAQIRREIREKLIRERYVEQNTRACEFTDEEVAATYGKFVAAGKMEGPENADFWSLVVNVDAGEDEEAWAEAEKTVRAAHARVKQGEFFGKVALEISTDPGVKRNGGFYERIVRDTLRPAIDKTVFTAELEALGEPFRAKYGWQFVRVTTRREKGTRTLSDAEREIYDVMVKKCASANAQEFVRVKAKENNLEVFYSVPEASKTGSF